jgi:hypothetical protein
MHAYMSHFHLREECMTDTFWVLLFVFLPFFAEFFMIVFAGKQ